MQGELRDYQQEFHTGKVMGGNILATLSPAPGMRVLDLGCGDGLLTEKIANSGADVVGVDVDPSFVAAAKARGLDVRICDGHCLDFSAEFDCVFSNAALHWMVADPSSVLHGVNRSLRLGGKLVAEMGGEGNVNAIVESLSAELGRRGVDPSKLNPWFFPSKQTYSNMLISAGFQVESCELVDRPTHLDGDMSGWLRTFCAKFLVDFDSESARSILGVVRDSLEPVLFKHGRWTVDYKRLRVVAKKVKELPGTTEPLPKRARTDDSSDR